MCRGNELALHFCVECAVFFKHLDDFSQALLQLIDGLALRVSSGNSRNITDIKVRFGTVFDDGGQ